MSPSSLLNKVKKGEGTREKGTPVMVRRDLRYNTLNVYLDSLFFLSLLSLPIYLGPRLDPLHINSPFSI